MPDYDKGSAHAASVQEVKKVDLENRTFDGQKADVYLNSGQLGGRHYLVRVAGADGKPTLIAIHL